MKYRVLGRTGLMVSELGLGGHEYRRPLPTTLSKWGEIDMEKFVATQPMRNEIVKGAIGAGINYFDVTHMEEVMSLGNALKSLGIEREKICIAAMIVFPFRKMGENPRSKWADVIKDEMERILNTLHAKYVDVFNLHFPENNYSREKFSVFMSIVAEAKEEGKVRWVGVSSHEPQFLAELIRKYDCFDVVMVRYNYYLQEARDVLFPLCRAMEIGVIAMKPFCWPYYGIPFMKFGPVKGEEGSPYTPAQLCLKWILKSPEISTIVLSMNSLNELEENLDAISKEGKIDEKILSEYLNAATGPEAKEKLKKMMSDPNIDIRFFAERALSEMEAS
ncbi:aldo/keto reductase [Candidatus Bathyarchaeota archaeon]|nr:aldo/keto reductase [Candidatus Bathyarchaeota archaeon]